MKNRMSPITFLVPILFLSLIFMDGSYAKEDFYTKTPAQKISEDSSKFLKEITNESRVNPRKSIPRNLICNAKCYVVIPSIKVDETRKEFEGEGLLSCHKQASKGLGPPIFYKITDIKSYYEAEGGLVILVMTEDGVNSLLTVEMKLSSDMAAKGNIGLEHHDKNLKAFITYSKLKDGQIQGYDLSGSKLIYDGAKTYKAYRERLTPSEILFHGEAFPSPPPPRLAKFNNLLQEWGKLCK